MNPKKNRKPNPIRDLSLPYPHLTEKIMSKIISSTTVKWVLSSFLYLFTSMIGLAVVYLYSWLEYQLFLILLATITIMLCVQTLVAGVYLFAHKNPYLQEWKNWFGYYDK